MLVFKIISDGEFLVKKEVAAAGVKSGIGLAIATARRCGQVDG